MSKNVLSVNENKSMNYLLQTVLFSKYWLISAANVYEAIHEIRTNKQIDLVIVDIDCQKKESLEFVHHFATSSLYELPIITLCSEADKSLLSLPPDRVFVKPFDPLKLLNAIDALLMQTSISSPYKP